MNLEKTQKLLQRIIDRQPGAKVLICYRREAKVKKGSPIVHKEVCLDTKFGINYDNKKSTMVGRQNGTLPKQNAGLSWGRWYSYPYLIEHKDKYYLRIDTEKSKKTISWYCGGAEVDYNDIEHYLLASEKKPDTKPVANIKLNDLISVG